MWRKIRDFYKKHRIDVWLAGLILVVALVPRVLDLGIFLTADEKNWMERSHAFLMAFAEGRFNDMLQTTHPGVTLLWVTGVAIWVQQGLSGIPYDGSLLVHFIKVSQLPVAMLNSLWIVGLYGLLRVVMERLGGKMSVWWRQGWPLLGALMIALDPYVIGYSRVVHVDALLSGFMVLAGVAIVMYGLSGWSKGWLRAAAVLTALALLTKIPAVFLLPWWGLILLVFGWKQTRDKAWLKARGRDTLAWLGMIVVIIVVVWPALLFVPDPKGNALLVKRDVAIAASTPHHMVEDYTLEAGHYVFTLLTRTTPATQLFALVGVVVLTVVTWRGWKTAKGRKISPQTLSAAWLVVAYIFFFVLMMTLGAKKGDRYILPVWPALDLLAAGGVLVAAEGLRRGWPAWREKWTLVLSGGVIAYLVVLVGYYHPYTLAYSNPLLASDLSQSLGWGEGLEQAAAWIDAKDSKAVVASWYPEEFAAFSKARVLHISQHEYPKVRYVVLYRNMLGRAEDHPATAFVNEYLGQREPVHVVRIAGKEYIWIFERPAFEQVVGELIPGRRVGQVLPVQQAEVAALDVLFANYQGVAKEGEVVVRLLNKRGGRELTRWTQPVAELGDNEWLTLTLPDGVRLDEGEAAYVEIFTQGSVGERAPTVLFTKMYADASRPMIIDGESQEGNLGVRWRYQVNGLLLTDQDVKKF